MQIFVVAFEKCNFCCICFSRLPKSRYYRCVAKCDEGYFLDGYKCRACSPNCKTCIKAEQCETCPGAQLLIDVNHYGHLDHGQCIDLCPPELEPDCKWCENHLSVSNFLVNCWTVRVKSLFDQKTWISEKLCIQIFFIGQIS